MCLKTSIKTGCAPNETTAGVMDNGLPDLDQGINEFLENLGSNLAIRWTRGVPGDLGQANMGSGQ